jgi:hypothetical protein
MLNSDKRSILGITVAKRYGGNNIRNLFPVESLRHLVKSISFATTDTNQESDLYVVSLSRYASKDPNSITMTNPTNTKVVDCGLGAVSVSTTPSSSTVLSWCPLVLFLTFFGFPPPILPIRFLTRSFPLRPKCGRWRQIAPPIPLAFMPAASRFLHAE